MIIVNYKFNKRARELFKSVDIDTKKLERFSSFLINEHKSTRKVWVYDLKVKGNDNHDGGSYYFGDNEMEIGTKIGRRSLKNKRKWFLGTYFHELCHFIQDNIDNVSGSKIAYSEKDVEECNDNYYKNKLEIQAREFEEKNTKIYLELFHN